MAVGGPRLRRPVAALSLPHQPPACRSVRIGTDQRAKSRPDPSHEEENAGEEACGTYREDLRLGESCGAALSKSCTAADRRLCFVRGQSGTESPGVLRMVGDDNVAGQGCGKQVHNDGVMGDDPAGHDHLARQRVHFQDALDH